eukprot:364596-Chlamydomonas_euryale.AAC.3
MPAAQTASCICERVETQNAPGSNSHAACLVPSQAVMLLRGNTRTALACGPALTWAGFVLSYLLGLCYVAP